MCAQLGDELASWRDKRRTRMNMEKVSAEINENNKER
jgi:hypothetical protein